MQKQKCLFDNFRNFEKPHVLNSHSFQILKIKCDQIAYPFDCTDLKFTNLCVFVHMHNKDCGYETKNVCNKCTEEILLASWLDLNKLFFNKTEI